MDQLYSEVTYRDIKTKIKLKTEEKMADVNQAMETLTIVVSRALGGKKSTDSPIPPADPSTAPKNFAELEARLNKALGG